MSATNFVVIHLSANAVRTVVGSKSACETKMELLSVGIAKTQGFRCGEIVHRGELISAIRQSIAEAEELGNLRIRTADICFASPKMVGHNGGGEVFLDEDDVIGNHHMVEALAHAKSLVVPQDSYLSQFFPQVIWLDDNNVPLRDVIGMSKASKLGVSYHLMSMPTDELDKIYNLFTDCGITVDNVVSDSIAGAEYSLVEDEYDRGVLYINIGATTTNFCLYKQNVLLASGCMQMGGDEITKDLMVELSISQKEAERLKRYYASLTTSESNKKNFIDIESERTEGVISEYLLSQIVIARYNLIFDEIANVLDEKGMMGGFPAGIVLAGEGSQIKDIVPYLRQKFKLPVHLTNQSERLIVHEKCQQRGYDAKMNQYLVERELQTAFGALLCHANVEMSYQQRVHTNPKEELGLFGRLGKKLDEFAKRIKMLS